jgi:hypothetical protein
MTDRWSKECEKCGTNMDTSIHDDSMPYQAWIEWKCPSCEHQDEFLWHQPVPKAYRDALRQQGEEQGG